MPLIYSSTRAIIIEHVQHHLSFSSLPWTLLTPHTRVFFLLWRRRLMCVTCACQLFQWQLPGGHSVSSLGGRGLWGQTGVLAFFSHLATCGVQCWYTTYFFMGSGTIANVQGVSRQNTTAPFSLSPFPILPTKFHPSVLGILGHSSSSSPLMFRLQQEPATLALLGLCLQGITFTFLQFRFLLK